MTKGVFWSQISDKDLSSNTISTSTPPLNLDGSQAPDPIPVGIGLETRSGILDCYATIGKGRNRMSSISGVLL